MRNTVVVLISFGSLLSAGAVCAAVRPEVAEWRRYPFVWVPHLTQAPALDGVVERTEWQGAAQLGPLRAGADGVSDDLAREVYVACDKQHLYIAFRLERPEGARKPLTPTASGRVDSWREGDHVEIHLDVGHSHKQMYNFCLYANGAYAEGLASPGTNRYWDCAWRQNATLTENGWQGEVAIPFTSLGLAGPPRAGEVWGFDFVDVRHTPSRWIAHWSYRGPNWHQYGNLGHLYFGAEPVPAVRFKRAEEAGEQNLVVEFEVVNATPATAQVKADVRVWRRKPGAQGGPKSYYDNIESGGEYDPTQVEFEKSTQLESLISDALRFYMPTEGNRTPSVTQVPSDQRRSVGVLLAAEPGEYLVLYNFRTAADQPLFQGVLPFRMEAPLSLSLEPYWLHARTLHVTADLHKLELPAQGRLLVTLSDNSGRRFAQQVVDVSPGMAKATASLSTNNLTPGFYQVEAVLSDAAGKEQARSKQVVEKPRDPEWHGNKEGVREVSRPWTPLQASTQGRVAMWGRTYDLSRFLPTAITSQGESVLAAPVQLAVHVAGKVLSWRVQRLRRVSAGPGRAVYEGVLESDVLKVQGTATADFDGFLWYDVVLVPLRAPLRVDGIALVLDVAPQHARLMDTHKYLHDPLLSEQPPTPAKGGVPRLEESRLPFTPYLWVGDEKAGLAFIAEGMQGWKATRVNEVMEVSPGADGRPARLRVHFFDSPAEVAKPIRLQFGLQATPIRPLPDPKVTHVAQAGGPVLDEAWYQGIAAAGGTAVVFHSGWKGDKGQGGLEWGGWPSHPPNPERGEQLKQAVALAHKYGLKVMLYTGWGVAAESDAFRYFGHELIRKPVENSGFGTYRQAAGLQGAYIDYMAYAIADLIRTYDIDGVFWDSCSNLFPDQNLEIGNGWIDDQGRVHPTYPVRATRELFRRIYNLVHGGLKEDGVIINFGGSIWAINAYADVFHRGEGTPMHAKTLREAWAPLEEFRASYWGLPFGLRYLAMNKNFKRLPMTVNKHHAVTLLHACHTKATKPGARKPSYDVQAEPHAAIWRSRNWLPLDEQTRAFYYFGEDQVVRLEPATLLSSVFVSGDGRRALVVVSNLDLQAVPGAKVTLDLEKIGFPARASLRAEDAITGAPIKQNGGRLTLDIDPERFRLLKLWRE